VSAAQTLGPRRMRLLARQWGRAPVRAAAYLRRPDSLNFNIQIGSGPIGSRMVLGPELCEPPNHATRALPTMQLLLLDELQTLHLIGLSSIRGRLSDELMQWPVYDVTVKVKPGKKTVRALESFRATSS
jgi:hypothetical protein